MTCETQRRNPKVRGEDTATMMLRHVTGAVTVVEITYGSRRIPDSFPETLIEIEGSEGAITVKPGEQMHLASGGEISTGHIGSSLLPWTSRPWHVSQEAVLNASAHMLEAFRSGREAETSGSDNLRTFALVEAAYLSARDQATIPLRRIHEQYGLPIAPLPSHT